MLRKLLLLVFLDELEGAVERPEYVDAVIGRPDDRPGRVVFVGWHNASVGKVVDREGQGV